MPVELLNSQTKLRLDTRRLKQKVRMLLKELGIPAVTVSILLTDDREMTRLHERWMNDPTPADVLSFPVLETIPRVQGSQDACRPRFSESLPSPPVVLGDIAISVERAKRRRPQDPLGEVVSYLVHGMLHLAGHDHQKVSDRRRMERQARHLKRVLAGVS